MQLQQQQPTLKPVALIRLLVLKMHYQRLGLVWTLSLSRTSGTGRSRRNSLLIPLQFITVRLAFRIQGKDYGGVHQLLRDSIQREEWLSDGSWVCVVECLWYEIRFNQSGLKTRLWNRCERTRLRNQLSTHRRCEHIRL